MATGLRQYLLGCFSRVLEGSGLLNRTETMLQCKPRVISSWGWRAMALPSLAIPCATFVPGSVLPPVHDICGGKQV